MEPLHFNKVRLLNLKIVLMLLRFPESDIVSFFPLSYMIYHLCQIISYYSTEKYNITILYIDLKDYR
jgi:hypothetical protein